MAAFSFRSWWALILMMKLLSLLSDSGGGGGNAFVEVAGEDTCLLLKQEWGSSAACQPHHKLDTVVWSNLSAMEKARCWAVCFALSLPGLATGPALQGAEPCFGNTVSVDVPMIWSLGFGTVRKRRRQVCSNSGLVWHVVGPLASLSPALLFSSWLYVPLMS